MPWDEKGKPRLTSCKEWKFWRWSFVTSWSISLGTDFIMHFYVMAALKVSFIDLHNPFNGSNGPDIEVGPKSKPIYFTKKSHRISKEENGGVGRLERNIYTPSIVMWTGSCAEAITARWAIILITVNRKDNFRSKYQNQWLVTSGISVENLHKY